MCQRKYILTFIKEWGIQKISSRDNNKKKKKYWMIMTTFQFKQLSRCCSADELGSDIVFLSASSHQIIKLAVPIESKSFNTWSRSWKIRPVWIRARALCGVRGLWTSDQTSYSVAGKEQSLDSRE